MYNSVLQGQETEGKLEFFYVNFNPTKSMVNSFDQNFLSYAAQVELGLVQDPIHAAIEGGTSFARAYMGCIRKTLFIKLYHRFLVELRTNCLE